MYLCTDIFDMVIMLLWYINQELSCLPLSIRRYEPFFNRPFDRYNAVQLEELDNQARDDNDETEWQVFITSALETIMKVCN